MEQLVLRKRSEASASNKLQELLEEPMVARAQLSQPGNRLAFPVIRIGPKIEDAVSNECSEVDDVDRQWLVQRDAPAVYPSGLARRLRLEHGLPDRYRVPGTLPR